MRSFKENWHWGVTIIWIGFVGYLWQYSGIEKPQELNGIGDFLAGAFAPLAFFWLVRGYYQQGNELQLNTKALFIQAEELKNNVEQQMEQVRIATAQLEIFKEKESLEIKRIKESVKPKFNIWIYSGNRSEGPLNLKIENYGASVTDVLIRYSNGRNLYRINLFKHLSIQEFTVSEQITLATPANYFEIFYKDQLGHQEKVKFLLKKSLGRIRDIGFYLEE